MRKRLLVLLALVITPIALTVASLCLDENETLEVVEIREFEGKNLSSISDFRENSIMGPQFIDVKDYQLAITGLVDRNVTYSYDEIVTQNRLHKKVVTLYCVEGWEATILWEGILVEDLISDAGINPEANTVIFYAYDGYSTSLPLDYIVGNGIIVAHKMNGVSLPPERGFPFQLVAESKWGYKWIKWITEIEVSDDENYRGFWESRGYSKNGDLGKGFLEP
ncbi:MAG: molybdopterin-dependent oxidoreductase [Candidatus Bathyarchaeota archaeon]|nr:molybdopterin-dependent oxidoreductase [Candidatus Bathyarchaeota archaeon]